MYGNTHAVADAIAEGLGPTIVAEVRPVHEAGSVPGDVDLLIVGGPTHLHGITTAMSRKMAVSAGKEGDAHVEPGASEQPGLREWLRELARARQWGMSLAAEHGVVPALGPRRTRT